MRRVEHGKPLFAAFAAASPAQCALNDGTRSIDYGELPLLLDGEMESLAQLAGARCGLLADSGCGWAIADVALLAMGVLSVPIPDYFTSTQLEHLLVDAHLDTLITDRPQQFSDRMEFEVCGQLPSSHLWVLRREVADAPADMPQAIKVTYTSGSTGTPRGVCLDTAHLLRVAKSLAMATDGLGITRHLSLLPPSTLLENVAGIYAGLLLGASCFVPPASVTGMQLGRFDPERLLNVIGDIAPHSLILVPELLRVLVTATDRGWTPPPSLRFVAVGGASVAAELLDRARAVGLPVYEGYGLSECGSVVALNTPAAARRGSVGRPLPHARVRIDAAGEIHVAGAVMLGYLGDPPLTESEMATGDLGRLDADGYLYVYGRRKNLLITSFGKNISPEWVECELLQQPAIAQALVIGEARPHLIAIVSPSPGSSRAAIATAIERCNDALPDYAHIRQWLVVREPFRFDNGLLTANGRLRRTAILERHAASVDALYAAPCDASHSLPELTEISS